MTSWISRSSFIASILVTLLFVGWLYVPGQSGPALLDDRSSVLVIDDLAASPQLAWDYVTGDQSGLFGRPVSMASFVLERLLLNSEVATAKRTNILLHLFNGGLLIWLFCLLFRHLAVPGYHWLALVLGAAWMLSPLLLSTVLYVVQRMAMLSATFMLLTCISFICWRLQLSRGKFSVGLLLLAMLTFCLALLAKENAVVLVPILLILECCWFQFQDDSGRTIRPLQLLTLGAIALGGLGLMIIFFVDYQGLVATYQHRYFTLEERVLTEARILWDYVAQIFYPNVQGMGLYHDDVVVSKSIHDPGSTLYALLGWGMVAMLLFALLFRQWGRYIALGVAWFLLGHSVESTVLPLELYFEHRNYFPAIGLFLLVGVLFSLAVKRWPEIKAPLLVYLACYVVWLASLTSSQVVIWSSHPLLILNNLNGHPDSFRANADMAVQMANLGEFEAAQQYSDRAFAVSTGERAGDHAIRDLALACIANRSVPAARIDELGRDDSSRPFGSVTTLLTAVRLLQDNSCPEFDRLRFADRMHEIFLDEAAVATGSAKIYSSLAILENALQRWDYAEAYTEKFLELSPDHPQGLLMQLHFATALGKVSDAEEVIARLQALNAQGKLNVGEQQTLSLYLEQ